MNQSFFLIVTRPQENVDTNPRRAGIAREPDSLGRLLSALNEIPMMPERVLSILRDPDSRGTLDLRNNFLVEPASGKRYPIRDGIPGFLDAPAGQNRKCRKNLRKWNREAALFHGEAEHLPFADEAFDVVYHVGGIDFFNDKTGAIREMTRVAKPGTRIVIVGETEKVVAGTYQRMPVVRALLQQSGPAR